MTKLQLTSALLALFAVACHSASCGPQAVAFAGGFGTKKAAKSSHKKKEKKKKRGFATGTADVIAPARKKEELAPQDQLDKWGLPLYPSEEDLFPPLHPQTELVQSPPTPTDATFLETIHQALRNHVQLDFKRFGEDGMEIDPPSSRKPMKLRLLHYSPPALLIENFFSSSECEDIKAVSTTADDDGQIKDTPGAIQVESATFSALASSKRTSTSWFCHYAQLPKLLSKVHHMLGMTVTHIEEPQIVRYRTGEEFSWHYDEIPGNQLHNGGQRVATFLVYLNDLANGGATTFRDLKDADGNMLSVKPQEGSALLFFPAFANGRPDDRTLHRGEAAMETKWITQLWLHRSKYEPAIPPNNSHDAAKAAIERATEQLGY